MDRKINGLDCTSWKDGDDFPIIKADPDIAGVGVIIPIMLNGVIAIVLALVVVLFFDEANSDGNILDTFIHQKIRATKFFGMTERKRRFWRPIIDRVLLALSDQQVITGLAVLMAGFIKHGSISVYHFSVVGDLAWFAATTHLITLDVLRNHFRDRPGSRNIRVLLISTLGAFLLANVVLEGHEKWYESWGFPAQCLFDDLIGHIGGSPGQWMAANVAMISFYYPLMILGVYGEKYDSVVHLVYEEPLKLLNDQVEDRKNLAKSGAPILVIYWSAFLRVGLISVKRLYIAIGTAIGSMWINLLVDLFWLVYGIWGISFDRNISDLDMEGNENEMTFGQIIPILMLSLTLLTVHEAFEDSSKQEKEDARKSIPGSSEFSKNTSSITLTQTSQIRDSTSFVNSDSGSETEHPVPLRQDTEAGNKMGANVTESQE